MSAEELLAQDFGTIADVIRAQAAELGDKPALVDARRTLSYAGLDALMDRIAAALQRDGVGQADVAAICASSSVEYGATFLGVLRAAATVAPLAPSSTPDSLIVQLDDCRAKVFFLDKQLAEHMAGVLDQVKAKRVSLDGSDVGVPFEQWLAPEGAKPVLHQVSPEQGFNIIYSSGTTGAPKGIVQPHSMRWGQVRRGIYDESSVTMISTPLYSNTTLVSYLPTMANGGTAVLMPKFDVKALYGEFPVKPRQPEQMGPTLSSHGQASARPGGRTFCCSDKVESDLAGRTPRLFQRGPHFVVHIFRRHQFHVMREASGRRLNHLFPPRGSVPAWQIDRQDQWGDISFQILAGSPCRRERMPPPEGDLAFRYLRRGGANFQNRPHYGAMYRQGIWPSLEEGALIHRPSP